MLGLGISLTNLGGLTLTSVVSAGKGAKAVADLLFARASANAFTEGYDCLAASISELGCDTVYDFADEVYQQLNNRKSASAVFEGVECFKAEVAELSR